MTPARSTVSPRTRGSSPTCCAPSCCARRRTWSRDLARRDPRGLQRARHREYPAQAHRWNSSAACSTCSPVRPARCWTSVFESDLVKALFGFDAIVGNYASPYAAGSAYVMLHHAFGEVNGKKGVWGHAIGGMGAITQAMARAAARPWRRDRARRRRARGDRRARPRRRRRPRQWRDHPRPICRLQRQSETAVYPAGAGRTPCRRNFSSASATGATAPAPSG